jgi:hypothetical protein
VESKNVPNVKCIEYRTSADNNRVPSAHRCIPPAVDRVDHRINTIKPDPIPRIGRVLDPLGHQIMADSAFVTLTTDRMQEGLSSYV